MKLNLEVELDWIDEEMNIDETIKQNIIGSITDKIKDNVQKQIDKQLNDILSKTVIAKISEMTENIFTNFINQSVTITDGYGSKIKCYNNITEIIKEKFDKFLTERVDRDGRPSTYDNKWSRMEYIVDKQLKDFADRFTTDAVEKVSKEIKHHVDQGLTTKLGAELMKVLKINDMLKLT